MSTALQPRQPSDLDTVLRLTDAELFTPGPLAQALDLLTAAAAPLVADVETEEGRREINRVARAVGGAIARLDERRRAYVADLKAKPREIDDLFRTAFRLPAEIMKERIRAPLTAWEEEMRAADEETTRLIALLNTPIEHGTTAAAIQQRLDAARDLDLPDWLSTTQRGEIVAALERNIPRLASALEAASRAEEQAAELARLRTVARDAELMAARQEAATAARAATLAEVAQQRAPVPAPAAPAAAPAPPTAPAAPPERDDRALIHRAILADLEDLGIPSDLGKRLITAIARGQVFHLSITY